MPRMTAAPYVALNFEDSKSPIVISPIAVKGGDVPPISYDPKTHFVAQTDGVTSHGGTLKSITFHTSDGSLTVTPTRSGFSNPFLGSAALNRQYPEKGTISCRDNAYGVFHSHTVNTNSHVVEAVTRDQVHAFFDKNPDLSNYFKNLNLPLTPLKGEPATLAQLEAAGPSTHRACPKGAEFSNQIVQKLR